MTIYDTTNNMTTTFHNTNNGASMVITKGTSDVDVIAELCQGWNIYVIVLATMTLLLVFAKATLHRFMTKQPNNKDLAKFYKSVDGLIDMFIVMSMIMQILVQVWPILT